MKGKTLDTGAEKEISRLQQVERELKERLLQQAVVASLGHRALLVMDLDHLMKEAVELTAETLGADLGKVLELLPGSGELLLRAGIGWEKGLVGHARVSASQDSQAGYALLTDHPVIVEDLRTETRFADRLLRDYGVTSGISVIIPASPEPFGVLSVHTKSLRRFSDDDVHFVQSISNVLASAIIRQRAEDSVRSSRDQLNIILQGIVDGITVQDPTGRLVYANDAAARIMGLSSGQDLLNLPVPEILDMFEIMGEDGEPFSLDQLPGRLALKGLANPTTTVRYRNKKTGVESWSIIKAAPIRNKAGEVELAVNIFQDITSLKRRELAQRLLAEAGRLLTNTLDYSTIIKNFTEMAVPGLADWCAVHVLDENGVIEVLAVAHRDPEKVKRAWELQSRYPPDQNGNSGVAKVIRSGKAEFIPEISDQLLKKLGRDEEHLAMIRDLGLKSAVVLPLTSRDRTLGALTLVWAESGRLYSQEDVVLAEELSRRAALAIDNARLYKQAQDLNADLEMRVTTRTAQLQNLVTKLREEVAERKKAEEALRQNETMLESLFESAPDATILVDEEGKIVRLNAQTEIMFGYERLELIGQSVEILLPERFHRKHFVQREKYIVEVEELSHQSHTMGAGVELYGQRKDGSEFPVDVMLNPVSTGSGVMLLAAVRDITESKRLQAELAELHRRLFESVEAERLHIAQEIHDGPMQDLYVVMFQLKGLVGEDDPHLPVPIIETSLASQDTVQQVINTLRSMCSDLRPPALTPFGLEKTILAHVERIQETSPRLNIHLDLMPDGQLLPERLRLTLFRIYQHAISNVIRHAKAENVWIRFHYNDEQVNLEVQDDGCGFYVPKKWIDFARKGHLGLVGTTERVEAIGGQMMIESSLDQGTRIQVVVPLENPQSVSDGLPSTVVQQ